MRHLAALLLCLPLAAQQKIGPVVGLRIPVYDYSCSAHPSPSCYRYLRLPEGANVVVPDPLGISDGVLVLAAPSTNPLPGPSVAWSSDLLDCKPSVSGAVATIKGPCQVNIGGEVFSITTDATATLSGPVTNGTVYWYWNPDGYLIADKGGSAAALTCNASCRTAATTAPGPRIGLPVATMTFTANVFTSIRDERAIYGLKIVECGVGTTCVEKQGVTMISVP